MRFNPPVPQQDSNWEIRVGVLLSLMFQVVLIFAGPLRKRSSSAFTRFVIWSCYLLADWVADLALGLLLNNMGNIGGGGGGSVGDLAHRATAASLKRVPAGGGGGGGGGSPIMFAFWAPFLLLHLGGPDTITAYSLADNELWLRHLIGLLFELSAAAVVFFCSLRGNKMVTATVLMFVAGVIKYGERTCSLYSGCSGGFRDSILGETDAESIGAFMRLMREFFHRTRSGLPANLVFTRPPEEFSTRDLQWADEEMRAYELFLIIQPLFVNGAVSSTKMKMTKAFFLNLEPTTAIEILEQEINYAYDMLYTKMPALRTMAGHILRFVGCCCVISSLVIFALMDKAGMLPADVCITYALLVSAVALDAAALTMLLFSDWTVVFVHESSKYSKRLAWLANASRKAVRRCCTVRGWWWTVRRCWTVRRWSRLVSQMNLLDDLSEPTTKGRCFILTQRVREIFYDFISTGRAQAVPPDDIMAFMFKEIKGAVSKAKDLKQMKKLHDYRGDGFLGQLGRGELVWEAPSNLDVFLSSVTERDFDESLLMWHIATNLCCFPVRTVEEPTLETSPSDSSA